MTSALGIWGARPGRLIGLVSYITLFSQCHVDAAWEKELCHVQLWLDHVGRQRSVVARLWGCFLGTRYYVSTCCKSSVSWHQGAGPNHHGQLKHACLQYQQYWLDPGILASWLPSQPLWLGTLVPRVPKYLVGNSNASGDISRGFLCAGSTYWVFSQKTVVVPSLSGAGD